MLSVRAASMGWGGDRMSKQLSWQTDLEYLIPFWTEGANLLFPKSARGSYLEQKARKEAAHFTILVFVLIQSVL